jgi:hypothetical protein
MKIQYKVASADQAKEICSLVNSVYRGEEAKKGWTNDNEIMEGQG